MSLENRSIALLVAPCGTEEPEFVKPREALEQAGVHVIVIGLDSGTAETNNNDLDPGGSYAVDKSFTDVSADDDPVPENASSENERNLAKSKLSGAGDFA